MPREIRQKVEIDTGRSTEELRGVEDAALDADAAVAQVDDTEISVDPTEALAELGRIKAEAKELAERKVAIRAELDAAGFDTGEVRRRLDDIPDRKQVTVDVDTEGAGKSVDGLGGKIRDIGGVVDEQTAGIAGDFAEAFEGVAEAAENAGPRAKAALDWVQNLGVAAVAVGGAIWALTTINGWLNTIIVKATDSKAAMDEFAAATDLATAALAAQKLEQQAMADQGLLDRLGQAWSGYYSSRDAREEAFQELLAGSPALAQKFIDTIRESEKYAVIPYGWKGDLDDLAGKTIVATDEIAKMQAKVDEQKAAEVAARIANEEWSAQVQKAYEEATGKVDAHNAALAAVPAEKVTDLKVNVPDDFGVIAPGYQPTIRVDVSTVMPVDLVAAGRVIDRALQDWYRASGGRGLSYG